MSCSDGTLFQNDCRVVEFKYLKVKEAAKVKVLESPDPKDVKRVKNYAMDINREFPVYHIRMYVVYIAAGKVCRCEKYIDCKFIKYINRRNYNCVHVEDK